MWSPQGGGIGRSGGEQGGLGLRSSYWWNVTICQNNYVWSVFSREDKMSATKREYAANYREPSEHTRFKKGQSGNPRGRSASARR